MRLSLLLGAFATKSHQSHFQESWIQRLGLSGLSNLPLEPTLGEEAGEGHQANQQSSQAWLGQASTPEHGSPLRSIAESSPERDRKQRCEPRQKH